MPKSIPTDQRNLPIHTIRHRHLKATIWRNQTQKGTMYNVMVTRSYRERETNEWRDTHSLGYDDLMNVAALMHEAHSYISNRMAKETISAGKGAHAPVKTPTRPKALASQEPRTTPGKELPF